MLLQILLDFFLIILTASENNALNLDTSCETYSNSIIKNAYEKTLNILSVLNSILFEINGACFDRNKIIELKGNLNDKRESIKKKVIENHANFKTFSTHSTSISISIVKSNLDIFFEKRLTDDEFKKSHIIFDKISYVISNFMLKNLDDIQEIIPNPNIWLSDKWLLKLMYQIDPNHDYCIPTPKIGIPYSFTRFFCLFAEKIEQSKLKILKKCQFIEKTNFKDRKFKMVDYMVSEFKIFCCSKMIIAICQENYDIYEKYLALVQYLEES